MKRVWVGFLLFWSSALLLPASLVKGSAYFATTSETPLATSEITLPANSAPLIFGVQTATPNADGSVTHTVNPGDTLIGIAQAYGIGLADLLSQNGLTQDSVILPDQELVIQTAPPPTATQPATATSTQVVPTSTRRPTRTPPPAATTPTPSPTSQVLAKAEDGQEESVPGALNQPSQADANPANMEPDEIDLVGNVLLVAIAVLVSIGILFVLAGSLLRRRS